MTTHYARTRTFIGGAPTGYGEGETAALARRAALIDRADRPALRTERVRRPLFGPWATVAFWAGLAALGVYAFVWWRAL